jgi:hypothetical protein
VPAAPLSVAVVVTAASTLGTIALALHPAPFDDGAALLAGGGLGVTTVVAVAGTLLARSRWARVVDIALAATWVGVGIALDSVMGLVVIGVGALALGASAGPWLGAWLRRLPLALGPPPAAVVALLTLVTVPAALGLASAGTAPGAGSWTLAAWSLALAVFVGRAATGSLIALRFGHPIVAVAVTPFMPLPAALVAVMSAFLVAATGWRRDVRVALVPVQPVTGRPVRLPPELVPGHVLDAAGLGGDGRPKGGGSSPDESGQGKERP